MSLGEGIFVLAGLFRSSRPDFIETRGNWSLGVVSLRLFRSSRPDFIETRKPADHDEHGFQIVPVFQAGLH